MVEQPATQGVVPMGPTTALAEFLPPGTAVEVRNHYDGAWARGFEVAGATGAGYRLRRVSDGRVLPGEFASDEVVRRRSAARWA